MYYFKLFYDNLTSIQKGQGVSYRTKTGKTY